MNVKNLLFGVGGILRERVSGWATTDNGQAHVYPDHPPLDLAKSSYPRGTVDTLAHRPQLETIDGKVIKGQTVLDITAYSVNSKELNELVGDSINAVINHWDGTSDGSANGFASGDNYLNDFWFMRIGNLGPVFEEVTEKGFTRYHKTFEYEFSYIDIESSTDTPADIGGTEIGAITDIETNRDVPWSETKDVAEVEPTYTTHQPGNERLTISTALHEDIHSSGSSLKTQKDNISALAETDPSGNRFEFRQWDGWLGITNVSFSSDETDLLESEITGIYHKFEDYETHDNFS